MVSELVKQRVVGVVVLVLMMVVIVPWMLNHSEIEPSTNSLSGQYIGGAVSQAAASPMPPAIQRQGSLNDMNMKQQGVKSSHEGDVLEFHQQTKAKVLPLPQAKHHRAWYVQVGSFANEQNANRLKLALLHAKQQARIQSHMHHGKRLFRVYEGPFPTKAKALNSVQAKLNGQGIIAINMNG